MSCSCFQDTWSTQKSRKVIKSIFSKSDSKYPFSCIREAKLLCLLAALHQNTQTLSKTRILCYVQLFKTFCLLTFFLKQLLSSKSLTTQTLFQTPCLKKNTLAINSCCRSEIIRLKFTLNHSSLTSMFFCSFVVVFL